MHELGIVFQIIKTVEDVAEDNALSSIQAVTIELGEVSGVVQDQLSSCWKWAVERSDVMKGASLNIEEIPAITFCESCEQKYETVKYAKVCPHCGSEQTYLLSGDEMNIKDVLAE